MAKARILVVDDDPVIVKILEETLQKEGYQVYTGFQGRDGLQKVRELMPDLVILDVLMPQMNGFQVCRELQADPVTRGIAVLMLTSLGNVAAQPKAASQFADRVHNRMRGYDTGALEFMSKPVAVKELVRKVRALLWAGGLAL